MMCRLQVRYFTVIRAILISGFCLLLCGVLSEELHAEKLLANRQATRQTPCQKRAARAERRHTVRSFMRWNTANKFGRRNCELGVISQRRSVLRRLMRHGQAPSLTMLGGRWLGINKGHLAAMANITQDVKEFFVDRCVPGGDNICVHQVAIEQLRRHGWMPEIDRKKGGIKRGGNFLVQSPTGRGRLGNAMVLNYVDAKNAKDDPARFLVDKVVMLDENHMLGRASLKFGFFHIPVAYFSLTREGHSID